MDNNNPFSKGLFGDGLMTAFGLPNMSNPFATMAGFVTPTIDLGELDKKIADLKSVEGWIDAQASLLRATVQALEVQRNTIAMLQAFATQPAAPAEPTSETRGGGLPQGWPTAQPSSSPNGSPTSQSPKAESEPADQTVSPQATLAHALGQQAAQASIANAAAWWNTLQNQFAQVAKSAAKAAPAPSAPAPVAPASAAPQALPDTDSEPSNLVNPTATNPAAGIASGSKPAAAKRKPAPGPSK